MNRSDPYEWQRRSAKRYEDRLRAEGYSRFRSLGSNRKRKAKRYERDFGSKAAWIRTLPCLCCGRTPVQAAHAKSRGAGGTSRHLIPLHPECHHRQHTVGIETFEAETGLDLLAEAADYDRAWRERNGN